MPAGEDALHLRHAVRPHQGVGVGDHRVLQREVHLLHQAIRQIAHGPATLLDHLARRRRAHGKHFALVQQRRFPGLQQHPVVVAGRDFPGGIPLAVVELRLHPVGRVGGGVKDLRRTHQRVDDLDRPVPGLRRTHPPGSVGAYGRGRAVLVLGLQLRPQARALAHAVGVAAPTRPAVALARRGVVIGPHGDRVGARPQARRHVVNVIALAPRIAARRSARDVLPVDPKRVSVRRRDAQPRRRGSLREVERAPRIEEEVKRLALALHPDPAPNPLPHRAQLRRRRWMHRYLPSAAHRKRVCAGADRASNAAPRPADGTVRNVEGLARFVMPHSPPALVPPGTLRWARESMGLTLEEAAQKVSVSVRKLERAETGEGYLTMRQAENAADVYRRPLAALFVSTPPEEDPPEAQFRQLPGAPSLPWNYEMHTLARRIRERQDAAVELYDFLEEEPPWPSVQIGQSDDSAEQGALARAALGVGLDEQKAWGDRNGFVPLWAWTQAVERLGVLVMQDGSMPVEQMRGFAAVHDSVPAIVVNTKDDPRSRAFTLLHELGHLLRARVGLEPASVTEQWLEEFASGVLMPRQSFASDFRRAFGDLLQSVDDLALRYGVTPRAAAVRVARLRLASQAAVDEGA